MSMKKILSHLLGSVLILSLSCMTAVNAGSGKGKGKGKGHGNSMSHGQQDYGHSQGKGQGHAYGKGHGKGPVEINKKSIRFNNTDKSKIRNFLNQNPGVITGSKLPPGIEKNLARGKPLPPGIQNVFLPNDISSNLKTYPGFDYRVVGNDVVLVNSTTNVVADILTNVLK